MVRKETAELEKVITYMCMSVTLIFVRSEKSDCRFNS